MENMNLEYTWHDHIASLNRDKWNELFGSRVIKGYEFYQSMDEANIDGVSFSYLEINRHDKTIAIIPCFCYHLELDVLSSKSFRKKVNSIRSVFSGFMKTKIFGVGSLAATCEQHIAIDENLSKDVFAAVSEIINSQIKIMARNKKCSMIFVKEVPIDDLPLIKRIFNKNFYFYDSLPNTFIPIGGEFSPYPVGLKKKERKRFRDSIAEFEEIFSWEVVADFEAYAEIFEKQYHNVLDKSKNKFERMNVSFIRNVNKYLKNNSFMLVCRDKENNIRSTELVIEENENLIPLYLGIDYDAISEKDMRTIYFNVIFKTLQEGEKRGKTSIVLGQTSYYPKVMSGALVKRVFLGFNSNNMILQFLIKTIFGKLFSKTEVHKNIYSEIHSKIISSKFSNLEN